MQPRTRHPVVGVLRQFPAVFFGTVSRWVTLAGIAAGGLTVFELVTSHGSVDWLKPENYLTGGTFGAVLLYGIARAIYEEGKVQAKPRTPPHPDHVRNLQDFTHAQFARIQSHSHSIQLDSAMGRSFRVHFPDVAAHADEWNSRDSSPTQRYRDRVTKEVADLKLSGGNSVWNLLNSVGEGWVEPTNLTWRVEGTNIFTGVDDDNSWIVSSTSSSDDDAADLLERVGEAVSRFRTLPEVLAQDEMQSRFSRMRETLMDELDVVEHTHNIARRPDCALCRTED
jgi:hypothetical protein